MNDEVKVAGAGDELAAENEPSEYRPRFPIIGIGASAGGLSALETILKHLALDSMGFVVIQHLAPDHESKLSELLQRSTAMDVVTATDGMRVEQNRIHVIPPGTDLSIHRGVLHLVQQ